MKITKKMLALLVSAVLILSLGACVVKVPPAKVMTAQEEAKALGFEKASSVDSVEAGKYASLEVKVRDDYKDLVEWKSSDTAVATVDSNGRVDGIKEGEAVITAQVLSATLDFPVTITKAKAVTLSNTTATYAGTAAMQTLKDNKRTETKMNLYSILVNLDEHTVVAYTYDKYDEYTVPVKKMICATEADEKLILKRDYYIDKKERWYEGEDNKYYQYSTSFNDEDYEDTFRFCTAPYSKVGSAYLIAEDYNKIGTSATDGDIWLSAADAQWIYENCTENTHIRVYRNYKTSLETPVPLRLSDNSISATWDPTDTSKKNPYKNVTPYFEGVEDKEIAKGTAFDAMESVAVYTTCGEKITRGVTVDGSVNTRVPGIYTLSYYYTDELNRQGRADRIITVK